MDGVQSNRKLLTVLLYNFRRDDYFYDLQVNDQSAHYSMQKVEATSGTTKKWGGKI